MVFGETCFHLADRRADRRLPSLDLRNRRMAGKAAEWLVTALEADIVVMIDLRDDLAHIGKLALFERRIACRRIVLPVDRPDSVDVVLDVEGIEAPHLVRIRIAEERQLDDDTATLGFGQEAVKAIEELGAPPIEVEAREAIRGEFRA